MITTIQIKDFCDNALSITNGEIIQKEIMKYLNEKTEKIILDFSGIELFATPFFNASIGFCITLLSPIKFDSVIQCINLSVLGKETFNYSYSNAIAVYNKHYSQEEKDDISTIIDSTVENS